MGLNVYDMTARRGIYGVKCKCNRANIIIMGPHVQCVKMYI
jgi:hypothetical protein